MACRPGRSCGGGGGRRAAAASTGTFCGESHVAAPAPQGLALIESPHYRAGGTCVEPRSGSQAGSRAGGRAGSQLLARKLNLSGLTDGHTPPLMQFRRGGGWEPPAACTPAPGPDSAPSELRVPVRPCSSAWGQQAEAAHTPRRPSPSGGQGWGSDPHAFPPTLTSSDSSQRWTECPWPLAWAPGILVPNWAPLDRGHGHPILRSRLSSRAAARGPVRIFQAAWSLSTVLLLMAFLL